MCDDYGEIPIKFDSHPSKILEDKMKKIFAFISVFLMLSVSIFADVSVKKLDNGKYEVTFFYGNPRAAEVTIAGDWTNWQNGAEPMTKTDKGWTYTKEVPAGTIMKYKFISDGNWTADIKAPDTIDDGFGGKNGLVEVDVLAPGNEGTAKKGSIKFVTWTMAGTQAKFRTQGSSDKSKKGMDFDSATLGLKSYNKLTGNLLPDMPFYVEIALAETELDDSYSSNSPLYIARKDKAGKTVVELKDGLLDMLNGWATSPVAYMAKTTNNVGTSEGPGSNPFLGHLKFGFNSPYVNWYTGFNYAKPEVRQKILWPTTDANWDAGYQHVGGFNSFSLGSKVQNLFADNGIILDAGFAPNKTADRKGTKNGYWGWLGLTYNDLVVDFQSNGMYDGDYLFDDPVEHDFILGAKTKFDVYLVGNFDVAAQALISTHQKSSADITAAGASSQADYFGYSTDVFYRTDSFDGIQNMAAEVSVGYNSPEKFFGASVDYRLRGAQASMLYLRENHDDGTFDLSNTLGELNSQKIALNAYVNPMDELAISLNAKATLPLEKLGSTNDLVKGYTSDVAWTGWYEKRCSSEMMPLFGIDGGMEFSATPTISYNILDVVTLSGYGTFKYNAYKYEDSALDNNYGASDSAFLFKQAGLTADFGKMNDIVKGLVINYGFDNSNDSRLFNTLIATAKLPADVTVNAAIGLKTVKNTDAGNAFDKDTNNPFSFAIGASKRLTVAQKPTIYAQFVFNMDPYKNFGDGQDNLALDGACLAGHWDKGAEVGSIDAVDWYDGFAAVRAGIRWDF